MNQMFIVSAITETDHADILMSVNTGHAIKCQSVFAHQLQTAIRCLQKFQDWRADNISNQHVSDAEIATSIAFMNDLLNLQ